MIDRAKEDETPISPKADSPAPEIFSSKKIFFLDSSFSGSRRSEIPHIEADYCPRDEVSRRLFHHRNESCDCDCTSDGCGGCLRRNKQCFFKFFVLALVIVIFVLLFGSLSYNLTQNKEVDESLEFEGTKWAPHYHEYPALKEKQFPIKKTFNSVEIGKSVSDLPVPVYERRDDYDSSEDFIDSPHYKFDEHDRIEPISFPPLDLKDQKENSQDKIIFIYDGREPLRIKRFISQGGKTTERDILKGKYEKLEKLRKTKGVAESIHGPIFEELNDLEKGMEDFWKSYFKEKKSVFEPFSLVSPFHSTPVQSEEYSVEEIEDELKNRFLSSAVPENSRFVTTPKESISRSSFHLSAAAPHENLFTEQIIRTEKMNPGEYEGMTVTGTPCLPSESKVTVTEFTEAPRTLFSDIDFENAKFSTEKEVNCNYESNSEVESSRNKNLPNSENKGFDEAAITETVIKKNTSARTFNSFQDNSKMIVVDERQLKTLWPFFHFSVPFSGLFGSSQKDEVSAEPAPLDTVKGISLADAKKIKKERRKHLLVNSRVVGGSSDVKLPTGPDASKPFVNAFETLKTNQQLSFTPSAASQFISVPYQMCLFAGSFPGSKSPVQIAQPRTFSFGAPPPIPSVFDKNSPVNSPYHTPAQQNFLSFSINNYPNAPLLPSPHQPTQYSGSSGFSFPIQKQFSQFPGPNKQPLFCTYLQPPLFQFPTVPGTADFSHAKCVDCAGNSQKGVSFAKELIFPSGRETLCSDDRVSCKDGSSCVSLENWCDNQVHCKDASDEAFCSCRERLAKDRLCDGYIDCPLGEDEAICFNCPKSAFSCDSVISPQSCVPLSKRCDGVKDCLTGADEMDCSALFFSVKQNNSYQVGQTSGYLHRNLKGDWFPVCVEIDGDVWAKEACLGELGVLPPNVDIRFAPVSGHYKGPFIIRNGNGKPTLQEHCKGHVATFVKCPAMSCGTRVELYNLQKLESHYFVDELDATNYARSVPARVPHVSNALKSFHLEKKKLQRDIEPRLKREETGRVVGGRESDPRAWPWAIAVYKNGAFHCGGVVLDENWVLTAAHCMEQYWKHYYEVRGGMLRRFSFSAMEQVRTVSHVIIHENYDLTIMSSDLALLRLLRPFDFNRWVRPACLPVLQDGISKFASGPAPGTRCIAVGWGAIKERGTDPDQLREVEIPIMTRCKHKEDLVGEEICAGKVEGGKDTCQGDSGGPLLCRDSSSPASWYVAGIVSHGEGCARPGEPGAYTRISLFIDWITANTNDFQLPSVRPLQDCPGFRCHSASKLCIPQKWICNGFTDCLEAEDEKNCAFDSVTPNIFNRHFSSGSKHAESESVENPNFRKNTSTGLDLLLLLSGSDKIKHENEKNNGGFEEFFADQHVKKKAQDAEILPNCKDQIKPTVITPLPSLQTATKALGVPTLTDIFAVKTTEVPSVAVGNFKMDAPFTRDSLPEMSIAEIEKNFKPFREEQSQHHKAVSEEKARNYFDEPSEKAMHADNKKKETASDRGENKKWIIEIGNEDEINSKSFEKDKENGESYSKDIILIEKKRKNTSNKMIYELKGMKNLAMSERESKSENNYKDYTGDKFDYQKSDMKTKSKEMEADGNAEKNKNDSKVNEFGKTEINSKEKFNTENKMNLNENDGKMKEVENETKNIKEEKEGSEEEEEDSISSESFSLLEHTTSTTEKFFTNSFRGNSKEILINSDSTMDGLYFTNFINVVDTKKVEKNFIEEKIQTDIEFTEPTVPDITTEATEESILTQTLLEQTFDKAEYLKTEFPTITPSQHVILARETVQEPFISEEYSTTYSVDLVTDLSRRNSDSKTILISEYFQCRLIVQSILLDYQCDGFEDCEDGTDEENCTCAQILIKSNPKLICDGRMDCLDRSDEENCLKCLENEYYCKISNECIPKLKKCNGKIDCRSGEDETKCVALAKTDAIRLDFDGEPFLETEGVLIINSNGVWKAKCQEEMPVFAAGSAIEVCSSLGTVGYERFENRSLVSHNCTGFFVSCAKSLVSAIATYQNQNGSYEWPWNAFVYSDGQFVCFAALFQSQWLLTSSHCLRDISLKKNYLIAALGNNNLQNLEKLKETNENTIRIDGVRLISESNAALMHLSREVDQSASIRPLGIPYTFSSDFKKDLCVAVGDRTVFLNISEDCLETYRCYKRIGSVPSGCRSKPWGGVVVCQSRFGWYPASVFFEKSGFCGFRDTKYYSLQDHLESLHHALDKKVDIFPEPVCHGFRCSSGLCIPQNKKCNGATDCPSSEDESFALCKFKNRTKECEINELKCRNGRCIPKVLFGDGTNDCGDESDEPWNITCVEYLRLTAPERICDGKRNCYDKTDEDYKLCSCENEKFQCRLSGYCVPKDFTCDGQIDCPGGEDEEQCMGRQVVKNYSKVHLEIMQKSYGIWHTVCPSRMTKERSDALCRDLGFTNASFIYERNQTVTTPKLDAFSWVKLNRKTSVALRGDKPFVKLVNSKKTCSFVKCA